MSWQEIVLLWHRAFWFPIYYLLGLESHAVDADIYKKKEEDDG